MNTIEQAAGTPTAVLHTLIRSDLRSSIRDRRRLFMEFLYPMFMLMIFHAIFQQDIATGVSYSQYLLPAMVTVGILNTCLQNLAITVAADREEGMLQRLHLLPAPTWAYLASKLISHLILATAVVSALLLYARFGIDLSLPQTAHDWILFILTALLTAAACTAIGLAIAWHSSGARSTSGLVSPIVLIMQFISGIFFPLSNLPTGMVHFASIFPPLWAAELMRACFLPASFASLEPTGTWEIGKGTVILLVWLVAGVTVATLENRRMRVDQ